MTKFSFEQKNTCKLIRKFTSKSLTPVNTKVSKETEYEKFLNGILANQNEKKKKISAVKAPEPGT